VADVHQQNGKYPNNEKDEDSISGNKPGPERAHRITPTSGDSSRPSCPLHQEQLRIGWACPTPLGTPCGSKISRPRTPADCSHPAAGPTNCTPVLHARTPSRFPIHSKRASVSDNQPVTARPRASFAEFSAERAACLFGAARPSFPLPRGEGQGEGRSSRNHSPRAPDPLIPHMQSEAPCAFQTL